MDAEHESLFASPVSEIVEHEILTWEGTDRERRVVRDCRRCVVSPETYGTGVVAASGIAHIVPMYGDTTLCGKDATGPEWWWPL